MDESVEARWRALMGAGVPGMREVDADSVLRMILGVNELNQPYFFVLLTSRPRAPQLSSAITVEVGQRDNDALWTLTLRLTDPDLTDAFLSLISDIAERSAAEPSEPAAWAVFEGMLTDLQHLLVPRRERLSIERLRGLIAEIWFGFEVAGHGHTLEAAVIAWNGPLGGEQDFNFPMPAIQFEVKSVRPFRAIVDISSLGQLDRDDIQLAVVTVEDRPAGVGGITLPALVAAVRERIQDPGLRAEFNRRLAGLAVDLGDPWYREQHFGIRRLVLYRVDDTFPALRGSLLPAAIVSAKYRVDLDQLPDHIVSDTAYDAPEPPT